jgi:hypothetical protein
VRRISPVTRDRGPVGLIAGLTSSTGRGIPTGRPGASTSSDARDGTRAGPAGGDPSEKARFKMRTCQNHCLKAPMTQPNTPEGRGRPLSSSAPADPLGGGADHPLLAAGEKVPEGRMRGGFPNSIGPMRKPSVMRSNDGMKSRRQESAPTPDRRLPVGGAPAPDRIRRAPCASQTFAELARQARPAGRVRSDAAMLLSREGRRRRRSRSRSTGGLPDGDGGGRQDLSQPLRFGPA